jgi:hypothetical protein
MHPAYAYIVVQIIEDQHRRSAGNPREHDLLANAGRREPVPVENRQSALARLAGLAAASLRRIGRVARNAVSEG